MSGTRGGDGVGCGARGSLSYRRCRRTSEPLSSPLPIFGFDGDGLCDVSPRPAGCPFGPYGYEGPGTRFSDISADQTSGVVHFTGGIPPSAGIPPGGSTYFSLEERIQTLCAPLDVPLVKQCDEPWGSMLYAGHTEQDKKKTLCDWGCSLTSVVMIINYQARTQGKGFTTDPLTLNKWLQDNKGYDENNYIKPAHITKYASDNGIKLYIHDPRPNDNNFTVLSYLCNGDPIVLKVDEFTKMHFVVATGQTTINGIQTFTINDPRFPLTTLLDVDSSNRRRTYNNNYVDMVKLSREETFKSFLDIRGLSPVELFVTDPDGRSTGYDPVSGQTVIQIPSSNYHVDFPSDDSDPESGESEPPSKIFELLNPLSGTYRLQVVSTGMGPFIIEGTGYDDNGTPSVQTVRGSTVPGAIIEYQIEYSAEPGSQIKITQVAPS
jgi:hypothetical protein